MAYYDITPLDSALEFDTTSATGKVIERLTDTRFVIVWRRTYGMAQAFDVNPSTGVITALSSPLNFNSDGTFYYRVKRLDDTHFIVVWADGSYDLRIQTFQVNAITGEITSWGSSHLYTGVSSINQSGISLEVMDSTHVLVVLDDGSSSDGFAQIVSIDGSGDITEVGTAFEYDTSQGRIPSTWKISDNKVIVFYSGSSDDGYARVLSINTSTWAVTGAGSSFEHTNNILAYGNSLLFLEGTPAVAVGLYYETSTGKYLRPLSINTSTWAISNLGSPTLLTTTAAFFYDTWQNLQPINEDHFIVFFTHTGNDGYIRTYSINKSTGALTQEDELEIDTTNGTGHVGIYMQAGLYIAAWTGADTDGFVQAVSVEVPSGYQVNDERSAKLTGVDTANSERDAKLTGQVLANSQRSAKLTGAVSDIFSRETKGSLPTDDTNLAQIYDAQEKTDVASDDDVFVDLESPSTGYAVHLFKKYNTNNQQEDFEVTVKLKSTIAPSSATVYLQVYNRNSGTWENMDSDSSTGANTEFTLTGQITSNHSYYFDANHIVSLRVYQQVT